jgi:nitroreductase
MMADTYKAVAEANEQFEMAKFEKMKEKPRQASHVIAIGMARDDKERVPVVEEIEAVACAVQNMQLTATAYGVGCYWGSGGITYYEEAKPFFGLRPQDMLLGFLYVGMPKDRWPRSRRAAVAEKTTWIEK